MKSRTITKTLLGEIDGWDEAAIFHMSDGAILLIQSGSSSSRGILNITEISEYPKDWITKEELK